MVTMPHGMRMAALIGAWVVTLAAAGCESPAWTHTLNDSFNAKAAEGGPRTEEEHRREYIATHSRKSMRWLLGHCVNTGMSYAEVCHALGEEGEVRKKDPAMKTGVNVRIDDEVYEFGPDSEGRVLVLYFREDRLINFDPSDFK